ncbi:leucine-rich repeat-containing protein 49 isoform X1 [Lingula anatina]|uniref:Leucine-rich repeat-containing protein 49 isoform X1 n=1 Tax=Lingula anatina TaxID=7574 RepID=A0A1S3IZR3_LINAN|nr:leucine-rich repeat-containing protein 49 isoform X1 [Lingula anatina]|eukprot:XP_013403685.1 leucine-rich repeat-containing protein 49 isoform X1 [Lingula anatina]
MNFRHVTVDPERHVSAVNVAPFSELRPVENDAVNSKLPHIMTNITMYPYSFEDISCLAESQSLSEVALDGNPFSGDPHYKTIMLRHLGLLKQLDLKRVTEEERRVAALMYKKEEDKRRNSNKEALVKEKRRLAINNAKRQWEVMQGSLMHRTNRLVKMPELYATHVGSYSHSDLPALGRDNPSQTPDSMREDSDSVMSPVRPSSARAFIQVEGGRNKFWDMKQNCFMTTGLRNDRSRPTSAHSIQNGGTSSDINRERKKERPTTANRLSSRSSSKSSMNRNASPEKETITYSTDPSLGTCHLAELEGDTLSLYGVGSLEALDRNWGIQAAGNITTIAFQFMDFTELVKHLGKIRARFPSVQTLIFQATNIESFHQLNALSSVRRLDNLVIDPEGNPVTQLSLWKLYTVFRLAHFSLKKINNVEVTSADILNAEKFFGPLSHITTSQLSQSRLLTLLGENRKKQLLSLSEEKSRKSPDGKLAEHKSAIESIGRAGLVYPPLEEQVKKGEEQKSKLDFAQKFVRQISREAVVVDRKLTTLYQVWPQIMVSLIQSAVMDMADRKTYMKKCMEDLEKG